jgi:hypothetical protein
MRDGYSVQMCQQTGALVLVTGRRELIGHDLVTWTAGSRADGVSAMREARARICHKRLLTQRRWCRLAMHHDGDCQ